MTTMTTLNDVRASLIAQGFPDDQVDAMLDLAGRMVLEGSLASKDDLAALRDEFTAFKIDTATQFAELRAEMDTKFAELRTEMNTKFAEMDVKFAEMRTDMNAKFAEMYVKFAEMRTEMNAKLRRTERRRGRTRATHYEVGGRNGYSWHRGQCRCSRYRHWHHGAAPSPDVNRRAPPAGDSHDHR